MEVLLRGLSCCFLPSLGLSSTAVSLRSGIAMGVSASCPLLSHDGCSLAHWPLNPASTLLTFVTKVSKMPAPTWTEVGLWGAFFFLQRFFLRKIKKLGMRWSSQQTAKECVHDAIQCFKLNGVCDLWLVSWCVQAGGVAFLCNAFFLGECPTSLPHYDPQFLWFAMRVKECGCSGWSALLFIVTDCELFGSWDHVTWPLVY